MSGGDRISLSLESSVAVTGTYDRDALLTMLFRETDRAQRMKTALCLLAIGFDATGDDFPLPNTPAHDEFPRQVASRLLRQLRSYDLLGRVGEKTFLAVLPGCEETVAAALAERIANSVFAKQFTTDGISLKLDPSFGIAASEGRSPIVVLRAAEEALCRARQLGPGAICNCGRQGVVDSIKASEAFATPRNS